jgi:kumamolisin
MVKGGTSAVAPLWAALITLINQSLRGRVGFLNPSLYALRKTGAFRPVVEGGNGYYHAHAGWNPCTGLGSPDGEQLLAGLRRLYH